MFFARHIIKHIIQHWYKFRFRNQATFAPQVNIQSETKIINALQNKHKIRIGSFTTLRAELFLYGHGGEIEIGQYCYIGEGTRIWSSAQIIIGDRVLIAHNVDIHDSISHPLESSLRHLHYKDINETGHPKSGLDLREKPVIIEDDAWIGFGSSILRGVTIGRGAIVGACSVVTKDVLPYTVVVGNPAQMVKTSS